MKLHELYEGKIPFNPSKREMTGIINKPDQLKVLGRGVQAIAYESKKHPNTIIKTIQISDEKDPALVFLRICLNHPDNPFLPRIYAAKVFTNKQLTREERDYLYDQIDPTDNAPDQSNYVAVIVMEKLFPIDTPENEDSAINLLQSLNVLPQDLSTVPENIRGERNPLSITKNAFDSPKRRQILAKWSDNPQFKQAMRLLEPLFRAHNPDLHQHNIMIRRTSVGPQLVLADPIISG